MANDIQETAAVKRTAARPFRRAVLRGLAVLIPPLFTILIIVWAINTTKSYMLEPVTDWARDGLVWFLADVRVDPPLPSPTAKRVELDGRTYRRVENDTFIPEAVYELVQRQPGEKMPSSGEGYYRRYVDLTYLRPMFAIPFFLAVFILLLYFLGKFMVVGIGGFFTGMFERLMLHMPGVRSVYSAIKQVTDFVFSEKEMTFTRIVAVEFPCKGSWSVGFVTGESLKTIRDALDEPVLAVLIPYAPPVTGCVITVRKSECIDLDMTFDQACQFIVSCGVVVPPHQTWHLKGTSG